VCPVLLPMLRTVGEQSMWYAPINDENTVRYAYPNNRLTLMDRRVQQRCALT